MVRRAHLEPLSLYQSLEASDGPAGRIKDDLSQGGHLQGGVRPLCTVNQHWRSLPDTHTHTITVCHLLLYVSDSLLFKQANFVPWPVDALGSQAGGGKDLLDMSLPAGSL